MNTSNPHSPPVRNADAADIEEIVRVTNSAYVAEAFCINGARTSVADVELQMGNGQFLVIDDPANPGQLLGSVMWSINGERGYLGMLAVAPCHQGQGLARMLIAAVEKRCRAENCRFLELTVVNLREELFRYYSSFGFTAGSTLPFPAPEKIIQPLHLVQMRKIL